MNPKFESNEEAKTALDILRERYTRAVESNDSREVQMAVAQIFRLINNPEKVEFGHRDLSVIFDAFSGNPAMTKRLHKALLDQLDIEDINGEPAVRVFNVKFLSDPTQPQSIYTRLAPKDGNFFRKDDLWGLCVKRAIPTMNQNNQSVEPVEYTPTDAVADVLLGHREALRRERQGDSQ